MDTALLLVTQILTSADVYFISSLGNGNLNGNPTFFTRVDYCVLYRLKSFHLTRETWNTFVNVD